MTEVEATPAYRKILHRELERRCIGNPAYSMRAFARSLGVDVAVLSRALSGRRSLSPLQSKRMVSRLTLTPALETELLESANAEYTSRSLRHRPGARPRPPKIEHQTIDPNLFEVIGEWHYYAILELTFLDDFSPEPKWIARRLGISEALALSSIARLIEAGLLERRDGTIKKTKKSIRTPGGNVTSGFLRHYQMQILERAKVAVQEIEIEKRCQTSMTIPMDAAQIGIAKALIEDFATEVCRRLSHGKRNSVYQLGISFFPLSKE